MNANTFIELVSSDGHPLTRDCLAAFLVVFGGNPRELAESPLFSEWPDDNRLTYNKFMEEFE
jgi:hypothetical protein